MMELRQTVFEDIDAIMDIIEQAKAFLKNQGIDQWQNGYPNREVIENDLSKNSSYVLVDGSRVLATCCLLTEPEKTYQVIYDGNWLSDLPYATMHRLAVDSTYRGKGLSSVVFSKVYDLLRKQKIASMRLDTHAGNLLMRHLIEKNGFNYCGIIRVADGTPRYAYEKLIE